MALVFLVQVQAWVLRRPSVQALAWVLVQVLQVEVQVWVRVWARVWAPAWVLAWARVWAPAWVLAWAQASVRVWAQVWVRAWVQAWVRAWVRAWVPAWVQDPLSSQDLLQLSPPMLTPRDFLAFFWDPKVLAKEMQDQRCLLSNRVQHQPEEIGKLLATKRHAELQVWDRNLPKLFPVDPEYR